MFPAGALLALFGAGASFQQPMARKLTFQGKAFIATGALLVLWWATPLFFKSILRLAFFEFQAPSFVAVSYLKDLQDFWAARNHSKNDLIEAGIDLSRLNAAYELRNQQTKLLADEVARLETLLDLPRLPSHRYEIARVVRRNLSGWWQEFVIRKGRRDGVREGYAVVFAGGVVGRVKEVHTYTAVVELLTSPNFRVAAHFEGDLRPIQFQGGRNQPLSDPRGLLTNVPPDVHSPDNAPRRVVSSRLGGVFPDGLTLGYAERLELEENGLFQRGEARLDARLLSLREVAVLIPLNPPAEEEATPR